MNLSELYIRRPIMTTLVMIGILIFGWMSYQTLPISYLPNVDYPTIQVTASRPGASPENMSASVSRPLEKQFSSIAGLLVAYHNHLPSGPSVVMAAGVIYVFSILFAKNGILIKLLQHHHLAE